MTPEGKGGWGASALKGLNGNASYDETGRTSSTDKQQSYNGIKGDGNFDKYDKGDGPEYVILGSLAPLSASGSRSRFCA